MYYVFMYKLKVLFHKLACHFLKFQLFIRVFPLD